MNETAGSLYGNVTLDMVLVMDALLLNQRAVWGEANAPTTALAMLHCTANLVKREGERA